MTSKYEPDEKKDWIWWSVAVVAVVSFVLGVGGTLVLVKILEHKHRKEYEQLR